MKLSQLFGSESGLSSQIDRPVVIIAIVIYLIMCSRQDLNLRPSDYESPALAAELQERLTGTRVRANL